MVPLVPFQWTRFSCELKCDLDPNSPWRKACRAFRHDKPSDRDLDVLVDGRVPSAAVPTVDGLSTFHNVYPQGVSVCITILGAQELNDLAAQALLTPDLYLGEILVEANAETGRSLPAISTRTWASSTARLDTYSTSVLTALSLRLDSGVEAGIHKMAYKTEDGGCFLAYPLDQG